MAKAFTFEKHKKRAATALAALLSLTLTAGALAACGKTGTEQGDDTDTTATATDTQLLKNGNFEFYSEMDETDRTKRLNLINTPNDWSFSSGSPASDTKSGIIDVADWSYLTTAGRPFSDAADAAANWTAEGVTAYDRLKFYDDNDIDSKDDFALYGDYTYTVDFEDLEYLHEVGTLMLHDHEAQTEKGDTSVLMIHNRRTSDEVRGTAQYYTSGTTITLKAGTAAEVSVWVKTSTLYHYAKHETEEDDIEVTKRAGAYIGVTHTVGGTTLDQLQIKNINTKNVTENNGWAKYTVYIRANTFATTTFRLVLGLGMGTNDQRYEAVDGYAFFDDVQCKVISDDAYLAATTGDSPAVKAGDIRTIKSTAEEKKIEAIDSETGAANSYTYALDLYTEFDALTLDKDKISFGLTEEVSGSKKYTSADVPIELGDNRDDPAWEEARRSVLGVMSFDEIAASSNGYLKTVYETDFKDKFPAGFSKDNIVMLLSTNGAAYTAKVESEKFTVAANARLLLSFFVKTSEIRSGASGAGATVVDDGNKSSIASFDSTTVAKVDVDDETKDIYKGWVQCFFFISNETETEKTFHLELTYGSTTIAGTEKNAYCEGYAAFANFKVNEALTKTEYSYATTDTYSVKATLTDAAKDESKFDDAAASGESIETGLATPTSYTGVQAGSNVLIGTQKDADGNVTNSNPNRDELKGRGIYTGLLNSDHTKTYMTGDAAWNTKLDELADHATDANAWWTNIFGNGDGANPAYQPLVILNTSVTAQPSYGYFVKEKATFSESTTNRVSVRVKLSADATAYIYLTDISDVATGGNTRLGPTFPKVTYWYDDDGNIVNMDPADKDFKKNGKVVYRLQSNGLYTEEGKDDGIYYANLSNYENDDEGNLTTPTGTIAYYANDGKYYAYRDEKKGTYSQEVINLPTTGDFVRYTAPNTLPEAAIMVKGDEKNAGKWVTVSFYVQTGNAEKSYRIEFWAGARDNASNGIPAGGYVFFDRVKTETISNYDTLLGEVSDTLRRRDGIAEGENLPKEYALYYTFTFFDSPEYLRYDASEDEEKLGNHWASYQQSEHSEELIWLLFEDRDGALLGTDPSAAIFLNYAAAEQTVTPDSLGDTDTDTGSDSGNNANVTGANLLLMFASILLALVLVAVIGIIIGRRIAERVKKNKPPKQKKKKAKKLKVVKTEEVAPEEKPEEKPEEAPAAPDENDPYNE